MPRIPRGEIDVQIGKRIRERRQALGLSQRQFGQALRISYQQVQKYEAAQNKIAASLLNEVAYQLQVPIQWFFRDLE